MVATKALILFAVICFQGVYSYCIHNQLYYNSLYVRQDNPNIPSGRQFEKHILEGKSECCHYTSKDCSPRGVNDDLAYFWITCYWPKRSSKFRVECNTGGAITVYGYQKEFSAVCNYINGTKATYRGSL